MELTSMLYVFEEEYDLTSLDGWLSMYSVSTPWRDLAPHTYGVVDTALTPLVPAFENGVQSLVMLETLLR